MIYTDNYISFEINDNITVDAQPGILRWYLLQEHDKTLLSSKTCIRIISVERAQYTKEYINDKGKILNNRFTRYLSEFNKENCIIYEIPEVIDSTNNRKGFFCVKLIPLENSYIYFSGIVSDELLFNQYIHIINSLHVSNRKVYSIIDRIQRYTQPVIDEYIAFFSGLLSWPKEKTLKMLEFYPVAIRDDIEDENSWFYHETILYNAIGLFFRMYETYYHVDVHYKAGSDCKVQYDPNIDDEMVSIILSNNNSCINYTMSDWKSIRDIIAQKLNAPYFYIKLSTMHPF